jgi:pimeloyl-ACP methyl ester carboxylesterase
MKFSRPDLKPELFESHRRKFEEVIVLVHFYGGNKKVLRRHIDWLNGEGFDVVAFEMKKRLNLLNPPITAEGRFGLKHLYAEEIESILNDIPRNKIVYAFSNPSAGAIEALAKRRCQDIKGLITDSGPSGKLALSIYNLYNIDYEYSMPRSLATAAVSSVIWSYKFNLDLQDELREFPKDFPVLSVIGWKDPLIPPDHIEEVFKDQNHLDWRKVNLPDAGHLNGLRDFPDEYAPAVRSFLQRVATLRRDK